MIWIMTPIVITWIWAASSLYNRPRIESIDALVTSAVLTSVTSMVLWSASNAPVSLARDRPELATWLMALMIVALVGMFWLKFRKQ